MKTTVLTNGLIGLAAFFATSIPLSAQASTVIVDGQYDEWDLTNDFFAPMHEAGRLSKEHLSDAYLRYDSNSRTLFVLVLEAEGATTPIANEPWAKIYSLGQNTLVDEKSGNNGIAPDFAWVIKDGVRIGWEGSFKLDPGNYGRAIEIHVNHGGRTSSTGKGETAGNEMLDTGDLSGNDGAGNPPCAPEPGIIPDPKLAIETKVQGFDADEPTGPYIEVGDKVHWLYTVTNTGNVPLSNIIVADSKDGVTPNCDGDNIIDMLLPGSSLTCSASGVAVIGQQANLGNAAAVYGSNSVSDEDPAPLFRRRTRIGY